MKSYLRYAYAILAVPLSVLLRFAIMPLTGPGTPFIVLFPATVIVALLGGMGPAVLTGVLGVLASDYFFVTPLHSFDLSFDFWSRSAVVVLTSTFVGYVGKVLREAKYGLEIKVEERTAELQRTNEQLKEENLERIRTEQSLRLEDARLDALLQLSQLTEAPLDEITSFTLEQAIGMTQSKIGFVGFLNEDETTYTLHSVSKNVIKECNVEGDPIHWPVSDAGIWADAIRERKTLFVNDYSKPHPRKKGIPAGHVPIERFMVVPFFEGDRIVALIGVGNKASDYDKSDERQIVLLLSGMWSCVLKSRSREELQKAYNELEERVEQRTEELVRSNKDLEQFAYAASHDLQEPLRIIAGYTQLLQQRYKGRLDEDADQFISFTVDSVVRMQNLINDLLSYSRIETRGGVFGPADCQAILNDVLHTLQIVIEENDAAITHGPLPTVQADEVQLFQLFQNLISNAIKFRSDKAPRIHITAEAQDERWMFSVKDNGIGIDPKYSERIFIIFQRLHRQDKYPGTGIGLAICKKIVERHGGRIWMESQPGEGATFYFIL
jgi:signal transduction histidine kinase